jgi:hypothetical protein
MGITLKSMAIMLVLVFLTAPYLIVSLPVKAGFRTLVVPDDYPTISSAIGNATAGDTILVREGTYEGPINQTIVIDRTISIVGENAENTIIKLYPAYNVTYVYNANIIQYSDSMVINANSVSLINLTLKFKGAIRANGDRLQIIGNSISSPTMDIFHIKGANCIFAKNFVLVSVNLEGSSNTIRQNILDAWSLSLQSANCNIIESNAFNSNLYLHSSHNNTFNENLIGEVKVNDSHSNNFDGNNITRITLSGSNNNVIIKNNIPITPYSSGRANVEIDNSNSSVFYANYIGNMEIKYPSNNNTFFGNSFIGPLIDDQLVRIDFLKVISNSWDNGSIGNYWSDYSTKYPHASEIGYSGIGNTPYVVSPSYSEFDPIAYVDNFPLIRPFSEEITSEPFPTTLVIAAVAIVVVIGLGLLVYFKRRNR